MIEGERVGYIERAREFLHRKGHVMSGGSVQQFIKNGVVREDIEAAKRDLRATRQMSQSLNVVGKIIDRELGKLPTPEMKAKFLTKLSAIVASQVD